MGRAGAAALVAVLALTAPVAAGAARFAVGLAPGAEATVVRAAVERRAGSAAESLAPLPALVVDAPSAAVLAGIPGIRYVELLGSRRLTFAPNDPLLPRQWYVAQNRSFDAWPELLPPLAPVRVAVIDSGIDGGHPDLSGRIAEARSFVGGSARVDAQGHGTFVAGLIAAEVDNAIGIAGLAPSAELLVAKVVTAERSIPVEAEARAIRWAVDSGARVINMSLGGLRDPTDASRDTYSPLEADAVAFAVQRDVLVVAAVGNSDQAPAQPWKFASYPAALPHVLGVSAVDRRGSSPLFSNRDAIFNDLAAPGEEILSTFPRALTAVRPACEEQGYSSCGPEDYRRAEGTSFAAPQVSAAAATLFATRPGLGAAQASTILERTAVDSTAANGCSTCALGRDSLTGWGRLDATAALAAFGGPLPPPDRFEPNDDAGARSFPLWGRRRGIRASLDYWDDQNDVYRVRLRKGERLFVALSGPRETDPALAVWAPATVSVDDLSRQDLRVRLSARPGALERLGYRAPAGGVYFVQVKLGSQGSGSYRLSLVKK
jgi:subtilisin family serine protease